ncbi:hypothetical protein AVENP_1499 [Arcobacter venerupis]|uniref:Uncharacterized protein n=1 Tax=Arcobacter venerupis TaxID=1054033 RepID=A0AAE7B8H5_9BACT|nr:hypothetical protein [Arcobacter venerupis]QKF67051.1 hypothetical protein AVENP_1499 [Arcobacter venerupis]RWS50003.1 hypothetical protein CKA56_05860 [Arcobacter venerupis]
MAIINFYRIDVYDIEKNIIIDKDISIILKNYIENLEDSERFCKGSKCSALLSHYLINEENFEECVPSNISFDFSKFTDKKINSAIISNPLEDIDTFDELNKRNIELETYTNNEKIIVKKIFDSNLKDYDKLNTKLKSTKISLYKIYKILINEEIDIESDELGKFSLYFYENNLNRLKKDKTYFNFMKLENTNILSILQNTDGFDCKKILEYLNSHILIKEKIKLKDYPVYEDDFSDILNHSDMKEFNFTYKCTEKSLLNKNGFNGNLETIFELFGKESSNHEVKISVNSEKGHNLNNEKISQLFVLLKETGFISECKVKKANSRSFVDSNSMGELLKFSASFKFDSLESANYIFLNAYNSNLNTILDRISLRS